MVSLKLEGEVMAEKKKLTELEESNLKHYGTTKVTPIPKDIVLERITLLESYLETLIEKHFMEHDNASIYRVVEDIKFWKRLGALEL